jgi:hypothetical protein
MILILFGRFDCFVPVPKPLTTFSRSLLQIGQRAGMCIAAVPICVAGQLLVSRKESPATARLFSSKPVLPIAATVLAALCGRLRTPVPDLPRSFRGRPDAHPGDAHHEPDRLGGYRWFGRRGCVCRPCARPQPPVHDPLRSCALREARCGRPCVSASAARSGSLAKFPPLAWPPLLAMSRCLFSSIDAKPRFEVGDWSRSAIINTSKLWNVHRSNTLCR